MSKNKIEFSFPSNLRFSGLVRHMASEVFHFIGYSKEWSSRLELVVDELFMNASRYGSAENKSMIWLSFTYDKDGVTFAIEDEGAGEKKMTPEALQELVEKNAKNSDPTKISGRGLALIAPLWTDALRIQKSSHGGVMITFDKKLDNSIPAEVPPSLNVANFNPTEPSSSGVSAPSVDAYSATTVPAPSSPGPVPVPDGPTFTIKVNGETDVSNIDAVVDPIARQVTALPEGGVIVLDFSDVDYINSSFIGHLASWYNDIQSKSGHIVLRNTNEQIRDVLTLVGLNKIIHIDD